MNYMNRAQFARDLQEGLNAHFGMAYREHPEEWTRVFEVDTSNKAFEEDILEYGLGAAQVKAEGQAIARDAGGQGWKARYVHETIALMFEITDEAIEDNLYQRQGPKFSRSLARAMKHTKEIKGADILNNAFSSSHTFGDGQPLLSAAHPLQSGGTWSNILSTPADLSEQALEDLLIMIRRAVDDRRIPISLMAKSLIIPPELEYEAMRILRTVQRPGTADNDINAIRAKGIFSSDPEVITRLTDPDAWYVKTDAPEGLKHMVRKSIQRGMTTDFHTGNLMYKARERYSFGCTDPRALYGSQGVG